MEDSRAATPSSGGSEKKERLPEKKPRTESFRAAPSSGGSELVILDGSTSSGPKCVEVERMPKKKLRTEKSPATDISSWIRLPMASWQCHWQVGLGREGESVSGLTGLAGRGGGGQQQARPAQAETRHEGGGAPATGGAPRHRPELPLSKVEQDEGGIR